MKPFRSYYAIVPAPVRHNSKLSASAKLLYAEVSAMLNEEAICAAPSAFFAEAFKCDERTVERWFKELRDAGLLFTAVDKTRNGSVRYASFNEIDITACREKSHPTNLGGCTSISIKGKSDDLPSVTGGRISEKMPPDNQGQLLPDEPKKPDAIDYGRILALYHELCPTLPRIRAMSEARKSAIRARHKEAGGKMETFAELFKKAGGSKFLRGETGGKWSADFDFLMSPKGFVKTLEGRYDDTPGKPKAARDETPDFS